ncbi:hypothetical protein A3A21_01435 [Candidatus Jorgensenbacteria bacterium RIFCSPLOWO2_01_FULL_45_25b]|uniref:Glycosyltransferase RgtA/B/C/D-like domain-containing protein n=1 Tax=Candidatus Jorgensenbacteria bacterium RIFCSPLOWO2_01_FULL_45_25b TaxID=1798471 RepID=A0A1F6BVD6_9BACT|nr:MAG: hypothetical protein A3A21_01435 [Candidatus Jorgensenbacteria bacterium RIFCSPLOWO2_01_FULL_45_25b]
MMNGKKKDITNILLVAVAMTMVLFSLAIFIEPLVAIFSGPIRNGDSEWYIAAANGNLQTLIEPYSVRFLHPFIAGWLSGHSALNVYEAFLVIAIASLLLFLIVNALILKHTIGSPLLMVPLFGLPYVLDSLSIIFHPDMFYMFLTALFFLLLSVKKQGASLLVLFFLFLTRESTILLGVMYSVVAWLCSKKNLAITIIVIMLISLFVSGVMKEIGQPNKHDLNSSVYLAAKLSYNFMRNVLGLNPWTNTYQNCDPIIQFNLPQFELFGNIRGVGVCGFNFIAPLQTLITLLTIFGIAPCALFYILKNKIKQIWKTFPFWFLVAVAYGLTSYVIGVAAGTGVQRIVGYGWPAFLLGVPILVKNFFEIDKKFIAKLFVTHLFIAWLPFVVQRIDEGQFTPVVIGVALVAYIYCFNLMKKQKQRNTCIEGRIDST